VKRLVERWIVSHAVFLDESLTICIRLMGILRIVDIKFRTDDIELLEKRTTSNNEKKWKFNGNPWVFKDSSVDKSTDTG